MLRAEKNLNFKALRAASAGSSATESGQVYRARGQADPVDGAALQAPRYSRIRSP